MGQMLRTDSSNTDFITLVALLDIDLAARDGEENTFYAQFNGISVLDTVSCIMRIIFPWVAEH